MNISKTLLLVEDDALLAMAESIQLRDMGYNVIHVLSGEEAICRVKAEPKAFDLVLMDINLPPGMDGIEAAELILREIDIPILFLSSHTEKEVVEKTEKITSYGYVVKDSGITVLDASIKMAFKLHAAYQKLLDKNRENETINQALRESEAKFAAFMEFLPGFAYLKDADRRHLFVNKSLEHFFGVSPGSWFGKTFEDLLPGPMAEPIKANDEEILRSAKPVQKEESVMVGDALRTYLSVKFPVSSAEKAIFIGGISLDITESKLAQKQLEESRAFSSLIVNTSPIGLLTYRASGECVTANPSAAFLTGGKIEQLLAQNFREVESWKKSGLLQAADEALQLWNLVRREIHVVTTFGKEVWYEAQLVPFFSEGKPHLLLAVYDVLDLKLAECELSKNRSLLQSIINGTTDAVYVKDQTGKYLVFNDAAARFVGKPASEVLGRDDYAIFPPDDARRVMDGDRAVMEGALPITYEEVVTVATGEKVCFLSTKGPIFDSFGKTIGIFGIARDVTDLNPDLRFRTDSKADARGGSGLTR